MTSPFEASQRRLFWIACAVCAVTAAFATAIVTLTP